MPELQNGPQGADYYPCWPFIHLLRPEMKTMKMTFFFLWHTSESYYRTDENREWEGRRIPGGKPVNIERRYQKKNSCEESFFKKQWGCLVCRKMSSR